MNNNLAINLDLFLQDEEPIEVAVPEKDEFVVDSLEKAVWVDEKAKQHEEEIKKIDAIASEKIAQYQAKIDRIKQWQEDQKLAHLNSLEWAKAKLSNYLFWTITEQVQKGVKKVSKSIKLPFRNISFSKQPPELKDTVNNAKVDKDNAVLLQWVRENYPELVETKESVKWGDFKKILNITDEAVIVKESGEMLDFIQVQTKEDKFDWKVTE
jgi:hypothetical protein